MKRFFLTCLACAVALTGTAAAQSAPPPPPELSAPCAVLMEKETGTVLLDKNSRERVEPASVTKIMTLLLIMEELDTGRLTRDEVVTVSSFAAGMGGSQVYLREGEQMTVDELLKCVVVVSGNDAAVALAEHLDGSESAFVSRMNQRAAQLGMTDTTFRNCTGLPAEGHLTSARDVALMARELIANHPAIRDYTTVWMDTIREGTFGLTNTNRLVRFYPGATGLKTGSTQGALFCMAATAQRDDMELIAVVMKAPTSPQRFEDAAALLDHGFAQYALTQVSPQRALPPVPVVLGTLGHVQPRLAHPCRLLVSRQEQSLIRTEVTLAEDVHAPVEEGQTLGQMEVYVGEQLRCTVPILSPCAVPRQHIPGIFRELLERVTAMG